MGERTRLTVEIDRQTEIALRAYLAAAREGQAQGRVRDVRVVVDTNVFVSALMSDMSPPARLLGLWRRAARDQTTASRSRPRGRRPHAAPRRGVRHAVRGPEKAALARRLMLIPQDMGASGAAGAGAMDRLHPLRCGVPEFHA